MGSGKTFASINFINESTDRRFLYITPYLSEVQRIQTGCASMEFVEPASYGTKFAHLKHLLAEGHNIVSTHALFRKFDAEAIELIRDQGYTLVLDEVMDVVDTLEVSESDMKFLAQVAVPDERGMLHWEDKGYRGVFSELKTMCDLGSVGQCGDALVWLFRSASLRRFRTCMCSHISFRHRFKRTTMIITVLITTI